jgi:hypothetical protein
MYKFLILTFAALILILSACTKALDNQAVVLSVKLLSYENKAWNLTSGPNIYCMLLDSPSRHSYLSTENNYYPNVSPSKLPLIWNTASQIPSTGHRYCLQFLNKENAGSVIMESIYFNLIPPKNLSSPATVVQSMNAVQTKAEITVSWK